MMKSKLNLILKSNFKIDVVGLGSKKVANIITMLAFSVAG